jgi:hypothetical protein
MTLTITYATTDEHISYSLTPLTRSVASRHFPARATISLSRENASVAAMGKSVDNLDTIQTRCQEETAFSC